jgi:hypothetical protein
VAKKGFWANVVAAVVLIGIGAFIEFKAWPKVFVFGWVLIIVGGTFGIRALKLLSKN